MTLRRRSAALAAVLALAGAPLAAQSFPTDDAVLRRIWAEGMDSSQVYRLAQVLTDSIGPRLTGSPGQKAANDWAVAQYAAWGIEARNERYGTWKGWRRGISHVDLIAPRARALEGVMLAWSPGTGGKPVEAPAMVLPDLADSAAYARWLPSVKGRYVLISQPQTSCRPDSSFRESATDSTWARHVRGKEAARQAFAERVRRTGYDVRTLPAALERAGARGVVTSLWTGGWGVTRIFNARTQRIPTVELSCEDYGLVWRLAEHEQGPVLRIQADAEFLGEVPVFNTIATIPGTERPGEYVLLSAHFDSWDGSSGATDNATGTVTMMEAMRILKEVYPRPKRTIVVGHWSGEEQGLNGSRAFAADHPEIVEGLQALFNQDNGTGRVQRISMQGLTDASSRFGAWFARLPSELTQEIELIIPGTPGGGGSDYASFVCYGAPAFSLSSLPWEYFTYTWHTNRDTFDKIVVDEVKANATLTAMLTYLAAEDPERVGRTRRIMPAGDDGQPRPWPECQRPARTSAESTR